MARLTAAEFTDKWQKRTKAATPEYSAGVARVTEAPGIAAGRAQQAMLDNTTAAITNGKWKRNVEKVGLQDWKDKATKVGAARITAGVDAAVPGMQDTATKLLATVDAAVQSVSNIPRGNLENNIQRAVGVMRYMAEHPIK